MSVVFNPRAYDDPTGKTPLSRRVDQIKIVKQSDSVIIPDRKAALMKRISDMETELGRMTKLLSEIRADALHLTVE